MAAALMLCPAAAKMLPAAPMVRLAVWRVWAMSLEGALVGEKGVAAVGMVFSAFSVPHSTESPSIVGSGAEAISMASGFSMGNVAGAKMVESMLYVRVEVRHR